MCNNIESEASPVIGLRPEYIEGDYKVLNYFLYSLGINLPENFPPELKEHISEGVFYFDSIHRIVFKEELRRKLAEIPDKKNKELYFVVFCEYMRNLWFYERRFMGYDDKIVEWSKEQGMKNGWLYTNDCSFFCEATLDIIEKEIIQRVKETLQRADELEENNNKNDSLKSEE